MSPGKAHGLGARETQLRPREQASDLPAQLEEQAALGFDAGLVDPPDGLRARVHGVCDKAFASAVHAVSRTTPGC